MKAQIKIKKTKTGNCPCRNCGAEQPGWNLQPYTIWHRGADEERGHNEPICSMECAQEYAQILRINYNREEEAEE